MKSYLITDPQYYSSNPKIFKSVLQKALKLNMPDMICFRDKSSINTEELIEVFIDVCFQNNLKETYINSHIDLAKKYQVKGVHLTSSQFDKINKVQHFGLDVVISCHTHQDIKNAIKNGVDKVTYSPIFITPHKGEPKGILELQNVVKSYDIKIIALGGIVLKNQLKEIEKTNCYGFASIRYFL